MTSCEVLLGPGRWCPVPLERVDLQDLAMYDVESRGIKSQESPVIIRPRAFCNAIHRGKTCPEAGAA